ncbi:MAG: dolichol-phosphate mannosyltransferase [Pseudonocardiales bacterium]|nr:dolichol-phosphate mannosyltransferase [Pseudonocardiales bacterium]
MAAYKKVPSHPFGWGAKLSNTLNEVRPIEYARDESAPNMTGLMAEEVTVLPPGKAPWFTVIVPTRNESGGVGVLIERLAAALDSVPAEVLFVDDSSDDTPGAVRKAAREHGLAVRLLHRPARSRHGGLGGAVVAGLKQARGTWAVVMDADLQHPPELVPRLVAIGQSRQLDLVAGTRYLGGGDSQGLAGGYRRAVSSLTSRITKATFPRRLARLSDPMSGFFAVRLAALDVRRLNPLGFKILMELAVREPKLQIAEVPFVFGSRFADNSKASLREGLRFIHHLLRLRLVLLVTQARKSSTRSSKMARLRRLLAFGAVGATGIAVNTAALWALSGQVVHNHYLIAAILATEASTTWNFIFTELIVFRGPKPGSVASRGVRFYLLNHLALLPRLPLLALFVEGFHANLLVANFLSLTLLFLVRFVIADSAIYAPVEDGPEIQKQPMRISVDLTGLQRSTQSQTLADKPGSPPESQPAKAPRPADKRPSATNRYLPYRYSIDGVVTVGSQVQLKELEYFRAQWLGNDVDLSIRIGQVGGGPRTRALMTQYVSPPGVGYEEHFGRMGANFRVTISDKIEVTCSPTLAHSPHVLYTNVIEALLRFVAVSRGVILLHSACLELNGSGLLLSARTDTGKTGSVLKLLREHGALFLSDDMTIVDPQGNATCFPKPLTISHHTLRAVQTGDLTQAEWRRLKLQSRLHSKEGRNFGLVLAGMNIPIMGVNSLTQRIVPPPKYNVDRLVECRIIRNTKVANLFVIERGEPVLADIPFAEAIQTLVENTDDAYGFPPFRQMAPSIVMGADDYAELRNKERAILASAMANIRIRRLGSNNFSWAEDIAALLASERSTEARATLLDPEFDRVSVDPATA